MIKNLLITLSIFSMISCTQNEVRKIEGHWKTIDSEDCFNTLDITDSVAILNKLDRDGGYSKCQISKKNDKYLFPFGINYFNMIVDSVTDTMYIREFDFNESDYAFISKWVRADRNVKDIDREFNCRLLVSVGLEVNNKSVPFDSIGLNNNWVMISLGLPNSKNFKDLFGDSFKFQMNNAFGDSTEIVEFLNAEEEKLSDFNNQFANDLVLIINVDKKVPKNYIDEIVAQTKDLDFVKNIYQTCINQDRLDIGLYKVR